MKAKKRIGIFFGGQSAEHEISIRSACAVIAHLNPAHYEIVPIAISQCGMWHLLDLEAVEEIKRSQALSALDMSTYCQKPLFSSPKGLGEIIDVVFPVLHGPFGEDGTIQGFAKLAHLPCVGSGVLGSALCMDKSVMKKLLFNAGFSVPRFRIIHSLHALDVGEVLEDVGLPLFVKPASLGSSLGIVKVKKINDLMPALEEALLFDTCALLEECIVGRELECSVLGNANPKASLPGEIIPKGEFYDYKAKYSDGKGAELFFPADVPTEITDEVGRLAIRAFQELRCLGMARVDFFLRRDGELFLNELNTIPGFTSISLYPKLWEVSGLPYEKLLDQLINLAIECFEREEKIHAHHVHSSSLLLSSVSSSS